MSSLINRGTRKLKRLAIRHTTVLRSPLKVALIGYGGIAPDHLDAYEASGRARVVGISDVRPAALAAALGRCPSARAYRDYRQMLAELQPDVVSVCTWPQSHAEIVAAAAEAGVKGILCEKPLALTLDDLDLMADACAKHRVKLAGGHQYRFQPSFITAARMVQDGRLGPLRHVAGCVQGSLANNGPHLIDTLRFLMGDAAIEHVACTCRRDKNGFNRDLPSEEAATSLISFTNGPSCEIVTGEDAPVFFRITLEGERGTLEITPSTLKATGLTAPRVSGHEARQAQFVQFLRWVKGQQPTYPADGEQSTRSAEIVLALYESARVGAPVPLPLANRGDVIHQLWPTRDAEKRPRHAEANGPRVATTPSPFNMALANLPPSEKLAMDGGQRTVPGWFSYRPTIGAKELKRLVPTVLSGQLSCTEGQLTTDLERAFARYYGCPKAVASTSGTAAIHVALGALGLNPGDEVVTTPLTDMGSVIPILACNCLPVFADVDPVTGNLTADTIAAKLTPRTKAVVLVHLFGRPADLGPICDLLRDRGIALVEDCSQAHDAEYQGKKVGSFGDFGTFSFQQSKQITCGDGGVTLVNRTDLAERAALFVDKGWDRKRGLRSHLFLGMNYRMTELQAAVALAQFERLPTLVRARRASAEDLAARLRAIPGVLPPPDQPGINPSWWMFPFRIDENALGLATDAFRDALAVEGVPARRQYLPVPIFEYDMLKLQRTYGDSGYPFTAFPYEPPRSEDFPGFHAFNQNLLFFAWHQSAQRRHVTAIATAIAKVAKLLPTPRAPRPPRALEPLASSI